SQSLLTRLISLSRSSNTGTARSTLASKSKRYFCSNSRLLASCHDSFVSSHLRDNSLVAITRIFPLALMFMFAVELRRRIQRQQPKLHPYSRRWVPAPLQPKTARHSRKRPRPSPPGINELPLWAYRSPARFA